MRSCGSRVLRGFLLILALALPAAGHGQTTSYLDFEGLTQELRSLANSSNLVTLESLARTLEGRDVWMLTVGAPSGAPLDERPGVLVVGNLEGDYLAGSHLALEALRYLVDHAGDEAVQTALATKVFYFFPRLNPDGAEAMFGPVKWDRSFNALPWDDDNDGRTDEDGPEDLNGDGYITVMRVADPTGDYLADPKNEQLMKKADPSKGESGAFKLYWEGTDNDGDGFINEDGPGGVDLNRNFQHAYPYWQAGSGPHMVSELESRALMDFAIAHRNIGAILTLAQTDNLVTPPDSKGALAAARAPALPTFADASNAEVFSKGVIASGGGGGRGGFRGRGPTFLRGAQPGRDNDPSSGTRPATTVATPDQVYYKAISDAYKRITGIENVILHRKPEGAFFDYGYFQYGVPSFSTLGWGVPKAEGDAPKGDAGILASLEASETEAYLEWTPFTHPELGEVEMGGFLPYAVANPPVAQLGEMGAKHGEFLVELAGMLPSVRIAKTEVTAHGGGVFTIEVEVENTGFLPTSLSHGQRARAVDPTFVQIQVDDDDILTGAQKTEDVGVLNGSGSREKVTWVIRGREGSQVDIRLHSQKSGRDSATVTLR
jgi:hypothetical protein